MESLLTSSESHAFQSFLSSIADTHDWNINIDVPSDKLALAKATKDLMALDQSHWQTPHQDILPYHPRLQSSITPSHLFLPTPPSDSSSRTPTPTSASPFTFPPSAQIKRSLDSSIGKQSKRPRASHPHPYDVSPISRSSPRPHSVPRLRRSQSNQSQQPQSQQLTSPSTPSPSVRPPPKPALLTASQKKANHIQSEQKRRANIRRGYDALCDCVPALREAIREEEEATATARSNSAGVQVQGKVRKGKVLIKGRDGEEKVDGRAGPRSENIVLSKTIDYISDLLDERSILLARLHRARSLLPPGHPVLIVPRRRNSQDNLIQGQEEDDGPLWEREWKGGLGKLSDFDEGEDSS